MWTSFVSCSRMQTFSLPHKLGDCSPNAVLWKYFTTFWSIWSCKQWRLRYNTLEPILWIAMTLKTTCDNNDITRKCKRKWRRIWMVKCLFLLAYCVWCNVLCATSKVKSIAKFLHNREFALTAPMHGTFVRAFWAELRPIHYLFQNKCLRAM